MYDFCMICVYWQILSCLSIEMGCFTFPFSSSSFCCVGVGVGVGGCICVHASIRRRSTCWRMSICTMNKRSTCGDMPYSSST